MTWEEVKDCVSSWIWDNKLRTYFWLLNTEEDTKMLWTKSLGGWETKTFFEPARFFKEAKKIGDLA